MLACPHCGGALVLEPPAPSAAYAMPGAPPAPPPPGAMPAPHQPPPPGGHAAPDAAVAPALPVAESRAARSGRGVAFFDGDRWHAHTTHTAGVSLDRVYELAPFHDQLYARLVNGQVVHYGDGRWAMVDVPPTSGLSREVVLAIAAGDDAVWFAGGEGLSRYGPSGWSLFTRETGDFSAGGICNQGLGVDRRGMVWYLSRKSIFTAAGLGSFNGMSCRVRTKEDGFPFTLVGTPLLAGPDDRIWFGTPRGVCYWAHSRFHYVGDDVCRPLGDLVTGAALDPEGNLWLSTFGSGLVARLPDEHTVYREADSLPTDRLTGLAFDGEGDLWLGTPHGAFRYREADFARPERFMPDDGLPGPFVHSLHPAKRGVWAVSGGSLIAFDMRLSRLLGQMLVGGSRMIHPQPYK